MEKEKKRLKVDKKTGHLLEVPSSKQVRQNVRKMREKEARKDEKPQPKKVFHKDAFDKVQKMIEHLHAKAKLPDKLIMARRNYLSTVCIINKQAKKRELLPDKRGKHVMLCHGKMARIFTNDVCLFAKIQKSFVGKGDGETWQDGSWSIVPCALAMSNGTTIQEVRRRPWFFLHRYWYEITFNGRVQPAMLMYDYNLNPLRKKLRLYVTREYVEVRGKNAENDYFRFWLKKPHGYGK